MISGLNEYAVAALRTKAAHNDLVCAALGVAGEAGEFADLVKKHVYHSHALDRDAAVKELGDVLWYLALAADQLGTTLEAVANRNIEKLLRRYPAGFTVEASHHRPQPLPMPQPSDGSEDDHGKRWLSPVRVLAAAGIGAAALTATGGFFALPELVGTGAALMLAANLYALVRR